MFQCDFRCNKDISVPFIKVCHSYLQGLLIVLQWYIQGYPQRMRHQIEIFYINGFLYLQTYCFLFKIIKYNNKRLHTLELASFGSSLKSYSLWFPLYIRVGGILYIHLEQCSLEFKTSSKELVEIRGFTIKYLDLHFLPTI